MQPGLSVEEATFKGLPSQLFHPRQDSWLKSTVVVESSTTAQNGLGTWSHEFGSTICICLCSMFWGGSTKRTLNKLPGRPTPRGSGTRIASKTPSWGEVCLIRICARALTDCGILCAFLGANAGPTVASVGGRDTKHRPQRNMHSGGSAKHNPPASRFWNMMEHVIFLNVLTPMTRTNHTIETHLATS